MATRKDVRDDLWNRYGAYLTTTNIMEYLNVSRPVAKEYISEHELKPKRFGGRWKYSYMDFAQTLA